MPRGDRTGPRELGAMTGRGAGYCAGFQTSGYANQISGRGFGMGFGRGGGFMGGGHGWRNWFHATGIPGWMKFGGNSEPSQKYDPETERQALKNQAEILQAEMGSIKKRLDELDASKGA